jgi:uncharacterized protein DUF6878
MSAFEYVAKNREAIFSSLAQLGIATVVVEYDGYGDSGQIDSVTVDDQDVDNSASRLSGKVTFMEWQVDYQRSDAGEFKPNKSISEKEVSLRDAIEGFCWDFLEREFECWETDDGAFGEFRFDVLNRRVMCVHSVRDCATSETEV